MKKLTLILAASLLTAGSALAADLPSRKGAPAYAPPPPPPPLWTGFYAGLNIGYGFGTNSNVQAYSFAGNENWGYPIVGAGRRFAPPPADLAFPIYSNTLFFAPSGIGSALSSIFAHNQSGVVGGAQIGYNLQFGSRFVIGVEADIQGTGISGASNGLGSGSALYTSSASGVFGNQDDFAPGTDTWTATAGANSVGATTVRGGVNWLGTVRGRIGYLFTPTLLLYGTGGLTYGGAYANVRNAAVNNITSSQSFATTTVNSENGGVVPAPGTVGTESFSQLFLGGGNKAQTLVGWNVGGGLEWMFMPNWSVKAEAIYWNMGNMNVATYSIAAPSVSSNLGTIGSVPSIALGNARVNYQGVIARAGVNYHFNWGAAAPIVAKY
jgi:outer membrane immunogenic protein